MRSTHGGGVVFKLTSEGPRYLLVEASGTRGRWVFPKGRVEDGETGADTALREVGEEAGVRARLVRRRIRWLSFDEAIEALDRGKSRRVLRSAHRVVVAAATDEPTGPRIWGVAARIARLLWRGAARFIRDISTATAR
jgi:8-oxo-dGTP pyrophosphatase MutT (NUDIX family)